MNPEVEAFLRMLLLETHGALDEDEEAALLLELGGQVQKRLFSALFERLSVDQQGELEKLSMRNAPQTEVQRFVAAAIPDCGEVIAAVLLELRCELTGRSAVDDFEWSSAPDHSCSARLPAHCAHCRTSSVAEQVWIIVDAARSDLIRLVREGTLNLIACPRCGEAAVVDAPLLLFRCDRPPVLIFAPRECAEQEELHAAEAAQLIAMLRDHLGEGWDERWTPFCAPREALPDLFGDDPEGAVVAVVHWAAQARGEADIVTDLIAFAQTERWHDARRFVLGHPHLLGSEAEELVRVLVRAAADQGEEEAVSDLRDRGAILRRCRAIGVGPAFAERLGLSSIELALAEAEDGLTDSFRDAIAKARSALQSFEGAGASALNDTVAAWRDILGSPYFAEAPSILQAELMNSTAACHLVRYEARGAPRDLEEAMESSRSCVALLALDYPPRLSYLSNLAAALVHRHRRDGRTSDLHEAVRLCEEIVAATPSDSPALAAHLDALGVVLSARYNAEHALDDLMRALELHRRAVEASGEDPRERVRLLHHLGIALSARHAWSGRLEDLDEAISLAQRCVDETPDEDPSAPRYVNTLANRLADRFDVDEKMQDLVSAIRYRVKALRRVDETSPDHAVHVISLVSSLLRHHTVTGDPDDVERSIRLLQGPLLRLDGTSPLASVLHGSMGRSLLFRAMRTEGLADIENSIGAFMYAIQRCQESSPLLPALLYDCGGAFRLRFEHERRGGRDASEDERAAAELFDGACSLALKVAPEKAMSYGWGWGDWAMDRDAYREAATGYDYALMAAEQIYGTQVMQMNKELRLKKTEDLRARAAWAFAAADDPGAAVVCLENARTRSLFEAFELERTGFDLESLSPDHDACRSDLALLAKIEFIERTASGEVPRAIMRGAFDGIREKVVAAADRLDRARADARAAHGAAEPRTTRSLSDVARAVTPDVAVVYLATGPRGSLALILRNGARGVEIDTVWAHTLTPEALSVLLRGRQGHGGWLGEYLRWSQGLGGNEAPEAWMEALDDVTMRLWDVLMGPLVERLTQMGQRQAAIIPCGLLGLLPLHAAWTGGTQRRYAMDAVTFTYAPSAHALEHARVAAGGPAEGRLLAIEEPAPVTGVSLPGAAAEVAAVASVFAESTVLRHHACTLDRVREALMGAKFVHFCCHGTNQWGAPLKSGLTLAHDERLMVRDFLKTDLLRGARLATLSSCESGLIGNELPDEVIAMPSALLHAGVAGVLATLWSISDDGTAMLMAFFYRAWRVDGIPPAHALRRAQEWMRDTTNGDKIDYFDALERQGAPVPISPQARSDLGTLPREGREFEHPFWWAGFYLTGV